MVQGLRVCGSKAESVGSVPGQGTKIPHSKVEKKNKNKTENQDSEEKNVILKLEKGSRIFFPWTEKRK